MATPDNATEYAPRRVTRALRLTDTGRADADLAWYYGPARAALERSTSGGIYEKLSMHCPELIRAAGHEYGMPKPEPVYGSKGQVIGYHEPATVEITGDEGMDIWAWKEIADPVLRRYAAISRREQLLSELARAVLADYYGGPGDHFVSTRLSDCKCDDGKHGKTCRAVSIPPSKGATRLWGLFHRTPAGTDWLARVAAKAAKANEPDLGLSDLARMQTQIWLWRSPPSGEDKTLTARRHESMSAATVQAQRIYRDAIAEWIETAP